MKNERRIVGVSNTCDAIISINDVKVLPEQTDNRSVKAASKRNWPESFVGDDDWQDRRSETLLVDTTQGLEDEIHLVMSKHLGSANRGELELLNNSCNEWAETLSIHIEQTNLYEIECAF